MIFENKDIYIIDENNQEYLLINKIKITKNFIERFKGLMFEKEIPNKSGLLLKNCNSIHMFFMYFPLDLIFLDKNLNILKITKNIQPNKIDFGIKNTKHVLEIPTGILKNKNYKKIRL